MSSLHRKFHQDLDLRVEIVSLSEETLEKQLEKAIILYSRRKVNQIITKRRYSFGRDYGCHWAGKSNVSQCLRGHKNTSHIDSIFGKPSSHLNMLCNQHVNIKYKMIFSRLSTEAIALNLKNLELWSRPFVSNWRAKLPALAVGRLANNNTQPGIHPSMIASWLPTFTFKK